MNQKLYRMRRKWLIERNVSQSMASEQADKYVKDEEAREKALMGKLN